MKGKTNISNFYFLILTASGLLLLTLALSWWKESRRPTPIALTPSLTGKTEYCLTCHADLPEISPAHPIKTFGCVICHGGERLALDANLAHASMRGGNNPSDLAVVEQSCGGENCHSGSAADQRDHIQRVKTSLQATYTGAITSVLFTFGAQADLTPHYATTTIEDENSTKTGITSLLAFSEADHSNPSIQKFAENCLNCHLWSKAPEGAAYARFNGCAACHTPLSHNQPTLTNEKNLRHFVHQLTTAIPYTQCNACHNRGNYDLRSMTFQERTDHPMDRLHNYYQPIAQFTQCEYTLDCIDCHTRTEAMGDGDLHPNQKEFQYVRCSTCHGTPTTLPLTKTLTDPNDIAFRLALVNPIVKLQIGDTIIITEKGEPLWNTRLLPDGNYELIGKATGIHFTFKPVMGSGCTQSGQDQSSDYCHQCHSVKR